MPIPDDEQFETYLKKFRPRVANPLPLAGHARSTSTRMLPVFWAACAIIVLVVTAFLIQPHRQSGYVVPIATPAPEQVSNPLPLTLGTANVLLVQSVSVKAMLDEIASQPESAPLPKGKCSALAVLSQENKL